MAARKKVAEVERRQVTTIAEEKLPTFFSSGCALLDSCLGGGWAYGRVINVVGDKSTGKTLLAIEACANFVREAVGGRVTYIEAESAFDPSYASTLGFPQHSLDLVGDIRTVEAFWSKIEEIIEDNKETRKPRFVIVDSLDALSDQAEMERSIGDATYGAAKGKLLSEGFRKLIGGMSASNITLFVISQIRDKIGFTGHGKKVQRSGGHALDFYASQVLWLYEIGKIKKTVSGIERPIGMDVKCRLEKSKVGWPWRECNVPIIYGYGMDDRLAALEFLAIAYPEALAELGKSIDQDLNKGNFKRHITKLDRKVVAEVVTRVWEEVDKEFRPAENKYTE